MYCQKCGATVQDDAAFCMACGSPLATPAPEVAAGEETLRLARYCTRCGAALREGDAFCGRCGAPAVEPGAGNGRRWPARWWPVAAAAAALALLAVVAGMGYQAWRDARELRAHYRAGLAALEAGDAEQAVAELDWVVARSPEDEDARAGLEAAREAADLAAQYEGAAAACDEGRWQQAIEALEDLRARAPAYEAGGVDDLLFTAYSGAGQDRAAEGRLDEAADHLGRALALRPDPALEAQKRLAELTGEGLACLAGSDPFGARDALQAAIALDPAYPGAAAGLYRARVGCCQALAAGGRLDEAEAECRAALQLQPGGPEAAAELARVALLRTPSPTPTPPATATWTPEPARPGCRLQGAEAIARYRAADGRQDP